MSHVIYAYTNLLSIILVVTKFVQDFYLHSLQSKPDHLLAHIYWYDPMKVKIILVI